MQMDSVCHDNQEKETIKTQRLRHGVWSEPLCILSRTVNIHLMRLIKMIKVD